MYIKRKIKQFIARKYGIYIAPGVIDKLQITIVNPDIEAKHIVLFTERSK